MIDTLMESLEITLVALAIGLVAFLYSSVGHAGASGYIAVMTLFGFASTSIRPTALVLNIFVASITAYQFWRAGHFEWNLFWPFTLFAIPAAYLGGALTVPPIVINPLLGIVLLFSAARLFFRPSEPTEVNPPRRITAFGVGAGIGLLSGLTGTGGGIFLTPLLLFRRWAQTRRAAAVSAMFVLANSTSGLAGYVAGGKAIPSIAWWLAVAAICGGTAGSRLGSTRLPPRAIQILLALVLVIAGIKLLSIIELPLHPNADATRN